MAMKGVTGATRVTVVLFAMSSIAHADPVATPPAEPPEVSPLKATPEA